MAAWIVLRPVLLSAVLVLFALSVSALPLLSGCHPVDRVDPVLPADRADLPLRIERVRGRVYSVEDGNFWKTNSAFWIGEDSVYFFDATWTPASGSALLWKAMTLTMAEFRGLVLTSRHLHHAGGAKAFEEEGIPVLIQQAGGDRLERDWKAANEAMSASFQHWRRAPAPVLRGAIDQELTLEGGRIRVFYPGPGWSEENLVVLFPEERLLYGGSLVAWPPLFTSKVDPARVLAALNRVERLPFDRVISGHGEVIQGREIFERLRTFYREK